MPTSQTPAWAFNKLALKKKFQLHEHAIACPNNKISSPATWLQLWMVGWMDGWDNKMNPACLNERCYS
jgi:hypothetical protein